jgi:DNA-binding LacI/PurR family transcriptional regulator
MSLTNPYHAELVEDIHLAASERGYDVVVSPLTGVTDEWHTALRLVDQRCEALVLLGPALTRRQLKSVAQHTPIVVVGRRVSARGVAVVRAADDKGVAAAVEHLSLLGHRRIAFVDGPPGPISTLRREGFRRAMRQLTGSSEPLVVAGGDTETAGIQADLPRGPGAPTAYIAFNDRCALGIVDQLRNAGPHHGEPVAGGHVDRGGRCGRRSCRRRQRDHAPRRRAWPATRRAVDVGSGQWLS